MADVGIVACDGLEGLPEAVAEVWSLATVQDRMAHLVETPCFTHPREPTGPP